MATVHETDVLRNVATYLIESADQEGLERLKETIELLAQDVQSRICAATCISKDIRIMLPGCFGRSKHASCVDTLLGADMMHAGHYNALRQAKAVCAAAGVTVTLVAGVHNDAAIMEQKGPTVFNDQERLNLVSACKWVDEVVPNLPYLITPQVLDSLTCDFVAHGDDLPVCNPFGFLACHSVGQTRSDGTSVYGSVIQAGRFKLIKRTEGRDYSLSMVLWMLRQVYQQPL
jgi:cytidyltransferase-like protein